MKNTSESIETFVTHFGEMGSRWGFSRTVAQMIALIVVYPEPLNSDQIAELLGISRGNVSMGLKELHSWGLIKTVRHQGDRKEYFTTAGSIWDLAKIVFEERSRRELAPTLSLLRSQLLQEPNNNVDKHAQQKMSEIHDLLDMLSEWSNSVSSLTMDQLQTLVKMGSGVTKVLEFKNKIL